MTDTPKRVVPITVNVTPKADGSVDIECSPNPVGIGKGSSNVLLTFTLATAGYRFKQTKTIQPDVVPSEDFPFASWTISDTLAALYDSNVKEDTIAYTVRVVDIKTGVEYSVDPEIKNGGGGTPGCDYD
jgi:hypothetical protein